MVRALSSDTVIYRIPQHLRESNPQLSKFLQYYYAWAEEQGNSLDLLSNLIQYKDIDTATDFFANLTMKQFLKQFPEEVQVDKRLLVKNIREFFVAKGTIPSFEFLMNALFSEKVSLDWQSKYVFRASDNEYTKDALIAVEVVSGDFVNIVGSKIEQSLPTVAQAYCISVESDTINGKNVRILGMDPQKLTNTFTIGSTVKILKNTVDRNDAVSGDFAYGVVLPCLSNIQLTKPGAIYNAGDHVTFIDGNGVYASAIVESVGLGEISSIRIEDGGTGYAVGDAITTLIPSVFDAEVTKVDGYGAEFDVSMEVNSMFVQHAGYGYAVGDVLEAENAGFRDLAYYPLRIEVTAVDSAWALSNIRIDTPGIAYQYRNVVLYDVTGDALVAGFGATIFSDGKAPVYAAKWLVPQTLNQGSISDIMITAYPTITHGNLQVKCNGFNCDATANIVGDAISTVTVNDQGWNYVDPIVEVWGDGRGAICYPVVTSGRVTGITVAKGGSSYTAATVVVRERFGSGFTATPLLNNSTSSTGEVTTYNITERGAYTDRLNAYGVTFKSITGTGSGLIADLNFRMKSCKLTKSGGNYTDLSIDTNSGRGSGAAFQVTLSGGVVTKIDVLNGGTGYPSDATVVYNTSVGVNAVLTTTIKNGVIKEVVVVSGGSGYTVQTLNLLQETGDELLQESGSFLAFDSQYDNILVSCGDAAVISADLIDDGIVSAVSIISPGKGLKDKTEVVPTMVDVVSIVGRGAQLKPIIENGVIIKVHVLRPGEGYAASDTCIVAGDGMGATLTPNVVDGQVRSVYVQDGGTGYAYGTLPFIFGNGHGAEVAISVNTGITAVSIVNGGVHSTVPSLVVNDPTGTGAVLRAVVEDDTVTDVVIEIAGTNYTAPTIAVGSGTGTVLVAHADRELSDVEVTCIGSGYDVATVEILGTYDIRPTVSCNVQRLHSSLANVQLVHQGSGYTSLPTVHAYDRSGKGAISEITIHKSDQEFNKLPLLFITSSGGISADIFAISDNIGKVTSIKFNEIGIDYSEIPKIAFSTNALVTNDRPFIRNEYLKSKSNIHLTSLDVVGDILQETGDSLLAENANNLTLDLDDTFASPYLGRLQKYNWEQNIIRIDEISDEYLIATENEDFILTEDGLLLEDQRSDKLTAGDVIYGVNSSAEVPILYSFQASGLAAAAGSNAYNFGFRDDASKLNTPMIKLHNSERFQDFAYVLKCGLTMEQYESFIKEVVHPAGYKMFGDVDMIVNTSTNAPSTPSTIETGEELSISAIFESTTVDYASYWMVEPMRFEYQDTPMAVFKDFKINELGHTFGSTVLDERISMGRHELQATVS